MASNGGHEGSASPSRNFEGQLPEGEPNGELVFGPGLVDSSAAEIHLVIRSDGPAMSGDNLTAQITTFAGGCDAQTCVDTHFAVRQS